jgi:hypothetical protein
MIYTLNMEHIGSMLATEYIERVDPIIPNIGTETSVGKINAQMPSFRWMLYINFQWYSAAFA